MNYKGYFLAQDNTGWAPSNMAVCFSEDDGETISGHGSSIEDCKNKIDELIKEKSL